MNASNILPFSAEQAAAPATRSKFDYFTTKEISAIIKERLGYNSRQISVSKSSSLQYVNVTVRDAAVDLEAVKIVCASLHSWTMDNAVAQASADTKTTTKEKNYDTKHH